MMVFPRVAHLTQDRTTIQIPRKGLAILAAALSVYLDIGILHTHGWDSDTHVYWGAWRNGSLYANGHEFYYSPAFADVIWPIAHLPWAAFSALWTTMIVAALAWLLWPLRLPWRIIFFVIFSVEIVIGNVFSLFAVVVVVGFTRPQAWALPLLTKITPGLGVVWFAVRREWRHLAVAIATTMLIVLVSYAIAPDAWSAWLHFLISRQDRRSGWFSNRERVPVALVLAAYAAHTDRPRLLALAVAISCPVFTLESFVVLAALPRLAHGQRALPDALAP
jgi:hypothetical protein